MNFDDYERLSTPSVYTNMMAGACAGVLEHCVMYPMDSVKVKIFIHFNLISYKTSFDSFYFLNQVYKQQYLR